MTENNKLAIIFSGDLNEKGGIQSWVKTIKSNYLIIEPISLNCSRQNFHYPAFAKSKDRKSYKIVICCDPLSLVWASQNVLTSRLVIGVFHKDEWTLYKNNFFEKSIIQLLESCSCIIKSEYLKLDSFSRNVQSIDLPLIPRNYFTSANKITKKGNGILVLGRLEAFKGFPLYLNEFAKAVYAIDPKIKIHVVGKGALFYQLQTNKQENTIFHGYLDEREIYQIASCCFLGLSSGLSAIELSSIGLPVAVAKEDSLDMVLTCFTGNGNFKFQDDYENSDEINLLDLVFKIYQASDTEWEEFSQNANLIGKEDFNIDVLLEVNEIKFKSGKSSLRIYLVYLFYVILDKLKFLRFNFIHRIP